MYYLIKSDRIDETKMQTWDKEKDGVAIFTSEEWENESSIREKYQLNQFSNEADICRLENHIDYLYGTFHTPIRERESKRIKFAFYILKEKIIFIDNTGTVRKKLEKIASGKLRHDYKLERFFYDFLQLLIDQDILYLDKLEKRITKMEEDVLSGKMERFNHRIYNMKKEIAQLHRYYTQLGDFGDTLDDNETDFFGTDDAITFKLFTSKAERFQSEVQALRDYATQVQEVYQSEFQIHQNNVMKILTILTAIFSPLTVIVGWYGMNFKYMPELTWKYGYPTIIGISILSILFCLWFFKKKKFW